MSLGFILLIDRKSTFTFGSSAAIANLLGFRPVALRPPFSRGLPFRVLIFYFYGISLNIRDTSIISFFLHGIFCHQFSTKILFASL